MRRSGNFLCMIAAMLSAIMSCAPEEHYQTTQHMVLNTGWEFRKATDREWMPATVPGTVHTDLLANDKIPQPFYRDNEKSLQWIDKEDWEYRCTFQIDSILDEYSSILMQFNGLDTYTEIALNGTPILETDNMFRTWIADITGPAVAGENILTIHFKSPVGIGLQKLEENGYPLPAVNDQSENGDLGDKKISVFTRKAPYHYGWDWGPRFVTSGIWRDIELKFVNHLRIENTYFKQNNILPEEATIDAVVNMDVIADGDYTIRITSPDQETTYAGTTIYLEKGSNSVTLPFTIANPELWWPNGMGEAHRYSFKTIVSNSNFVVDTVTQKIGLRSVRLVRDPDSLGKSFYFEINGKPVFAKGANYIPNDNFLPRVSPEKYEHIVRSAAESNMNMLRVWGGGIYENEIFYELCDRYGLMVWQDFMFACSMYPGDDAFLESVSAEAVDNIIRLRNHACIVLWCGNNEIHAAWCKDGMDCGWGWKQRYTDDQRQTIWNTYDTIFHHILPDIVQVYDGLRPYWPSSPQADWGETASYSSTSGDIHYWGVWHGQQPFTEYYKVVGRFMSEYGFQSFPDMNSIRKFTLPHDWHHESEVMKAHQRSGLGNTRIVEYMEELYPVPENFDDLLYVGQVLQAEGIKQAIHAHRAKKPYCMGTLYWQLNDCWPAASWSSIDYYGSWKALQYYARRAYEPVIFAFIPEDDRMIISVCSDASGDFDAQVEYRILDFTGKVLENKTFSLRVYKDRATHADTLALGELKAKYDSRNIYLTARLLRGEEVVTKDHYYFESPKNLRLPVAPVKKEVRVRGDELIVTLQSTKLVRDVYLYVPGEDVHFSDNYFDLEPGIPVTVRCGLPEGKDITGESIRVKSLNTLHN